MGAAGHTSAGCLLARQCDLFSQKCARARLTPHRLCARPLPLAGKKLSCISFCASTNLLRRAHHGRASKLAKCKQQTRVFVFAIWRPRCRRPKAQAEAAAAAAPRGFSSYRARSAPLLCGSSEPTKRAQPRALLAPLSALCATCSLARSFSPAAAMQQLSLVPLAGRSAVRPPAAPADCQPPATTMADRRRPQSGATRGRSSRRQW